MRITVSREAWKNFVTSAPIPKNLQENLYISGISGSWKTTLAEDIAKREAENWAEIVYLSFDSNTFIPGASVIKTRGVTEEEKESTTKEILSVFEKLELLRKTHNWDGRKHIIVIDELQVVEALMRGVGIPWISREAGKPITSYAESLSQTDMWKKGIIFILVQQSPRNS